MPTHNHDLYLKAPSWISQHRVRLQGLTGQAEDEGREWDATERNDKVEGGGEEKSDYGANVQNMK